MRNLDLSIIIVNWNTKDFLCACLDSVFKETKSISFEVFVVHNASSDGSPEMVEREFPQVKLIKNKENLGFAKANNQAIRKSGGKYIFFLNPDTILINNAPKIMIDFMEKDENVGICGARLFREDMSGQVSYGDFPSLWQVISETLFLPRILCRNWFPNTGIIPDNKITGPIPVNYVSGASLMLRREIINKIGLFDEAFFAYFEEADLYYRTNQSGWKIYYIPSAKVVHYGGGVSSKKLNEVRSVIFYRSMFVFFLKHYGYFFAITTKYLFLMRYLLALVFWKSVYLIRPRWRDNIRGKISNCLMYMRVIDGGRKDDEGRRKATIP